MVPATLQQALENLYGQERRRDKLGLEGTRALLGALGHPERRFRSIHVAGTNGKGSVCALIERGLREAGVRTGLFTSPHLVDFRERIRVNGRWADEAWLFDALQRIEALPEGKDRTFFEVATALGFLYFTEQGVECAVVEVGLGGRLDTTNVLEPRVAVITSIGLDHTEILGDTIEKIAAEKGGIIKARAPVVCGAAVSSRALDVLTAIAREQSTIIGQAGADWPDAAPVGTFLPENLATAGAALTVFAALESKSAVWLDSAHRGMTAARWPGRFEACPAEPRLWWDGAHNPEGIAALVRAWEDRHLDPPAALVLATSRDKPIGEMLDALLPLRMGARFIATRSRNERALEPAAIAAALGDRGWRAEIAPGVAEACRLALGGCPPRRQVLLTGSLFAVGEAMEAFGGAPGEQL